MSNPNWASVLLCLVAVVFISNLHFGRCCSDLDGQQQLDRVLRLPGQNFNASFAHYAGYVTVDLKSGKNLFYWFTEAVDDPPSKPLVLWLNGGPGCSSVGYGMAKEIGPFHVNRDGKSLYLNPYSWNQVANILFLDSPVGVGYSYSNSSSDHKNNGDKSTAKDSLAFLLKWFDRFPQYKGRDFYITGESYAGHYIPQLSLAIVLQNSKSTEKLFNFKGFMVGNALTDDYHDHFGAYEFTWSAGVISRQTYEQLNLFCDFQSFVHPSEKCEKILDVAYEELGHVDPYSIFTPACTANFGIQHQLLKRSRKAGRISQSYDPCTELHSTVYFNLPEVQSALHVSRTAFEWETCSEEVSANWKDCPRSVLNVYRELLHSGIRIWIFSGDTDAVIPVTSTRYSIDALKLPTVGPWHAWYDDDGQVGGWNQQYKGLNFVTIRGAGHEVPLHRPKQALTLLKAFLSGVPLPTASRTQDPQHSLQLQVSDS